MARGFRFAAAIVAASLFGFAQEQPGAPEPPHDPPPTPDPCTCTITADLTGGKIDANGNINVQVKVSGSVKSTKKSEDKIQPMLAVHQYFVYSVDGKKTWIKMALPLSKVDIDLLGGAQTCGSHPDKFEKEYSTGPFPLVKDGKEFAAAKDTVVECEVHLSAVATAGGGTKLCTMTPVLRYIPFSYTVKNKEQEVASAEKGAPAKPYKLKKEPKKPEVHVAPSGYGWSAASTTTPVP